MTDRYADLLRRLEELRRGERQPEEVFRDAGPMKLGPAAERELRARLEAAVEASLRRAAKRFSDDLAALSEEGSYTEIPLCARRYGREVRRTLGFTALTALGEDYRAELAAQIRTQTERDWTRYLLRLRRQAEELPAPELDDLLGSLERLRLLE